MSWNHRVIKEILDGGEPWFTIHEVFYDKDGKVTVWTESEVNNGSDSVEGLKWQLRRMLESLDKEVLVEENRTLVPEKDAKP